MAREDERRLRRCYQMRRRREHRLRKRASRRMAVSYVRRGAVRYNGASHHAATVTSRGAAVTYNIVSNMLLYARVTHNDASQRRRQRCYVVTTHATHMRRHCASMHKRLQPRHAVVAASQVTLRRHCYASRIASRQRYASLLSSSPTSTET